MPTALDRPSNFLNTLAPQTVFVLVAGFFGIIMAFITPPAQVPDELHHWYRIYQLTQGKMLAKNYGGQMPLSITRAARDFEDLKFHPTVKTSVPQIRGEFQRPIQPKITRFEIFPNNTLYTILPYAPQTLGMLIARKLKLPALALMYAGRVGTALGYLLVGWWAIRITPILKWPACMILTSPMALFLAGSLSADPMTTAICFLATAMAFRCILSPAQLSHGMVSALALSMIAVGLCKPAYVPIVCLVFAVPRDRWGTGHRGWIIPVVIFLLTIFSLAIWSALAGSSHVKEAHAAGIQAQLPWVLHHPVDFLAVLRRSVPMYWSDMANSAVGNLGWLDTPLPPGVIDFIYIALVWIVLAYDQPMRLGLWPRAVALLVLLATLFAILTATYLGWAHEVGYDHVEGLQGRYLLPIAMLACIIFHRRGRYPIQPKWMLAMLSVISLYTVWVLIERYYLPAGVIGNLLSGTFPHT